MSMSIAEDIFDSEKKIFILNGNDYYGKMDVIKEFDNSMASLTELPLSFISNGETDIDFNTVTVKMLYC